MRHPGSYQTTCASTHRGSTIRFSGLRLLFPLLLFWGAAAAQVNIDAYREYFLVGQFGEVCTMCEVIVLCEPTVAPPQHEAIPVSGNFTIFHLQTRTFWSQVSTIWDWFIANFSSAPLAQRGHTRPAHVYAVLDGQWQPQRVIEARLILDPGVLELDDTYVDRVNSQWLGVGTRQPIGYCQRLPLWDALEVIEQQSVAGVS